MVCREPWPGKHSIHGIQEEMRQRHRLMGCKGSQRVKVEEFYRISLKNAAFVSKSRKPHSGPACIKELTHGKPANAGEFTQNLVLSSGRNPVCYT